MSDQSGATSDHEPATTVATAPVTVEQAAAILGVSVTTVRRRIRAGTIKAEEARRPQGPLWLVYLPSDATSDYSATVSDHTPPNAAATAPTALPAADAMISLIQTTIGTVLGPLVGQLDAQRQTIERQGDRVAELERENGRQTAELERAAAAIVRLGKELDARHAASTQDAPAATQASDPSLAPFRPLGCSQRVYGVGAAIVAMLVLAIVGVAVLLLAPRW